MPDETAPRRRKRERQLRRARAEQHKSARAAYLAAILKADGFVGAGDHGVLRLAWWLVLIFLGALLVEGRSSAAKIFGFDGFALIPVKIQPIARAGSMCLMYDDSASKSPYDRRESTEPEAKEDAAPGACRRRCGLSNAGSGECHSGSVQGWRQTIHDCAAVQGFAVRR